MKFFFSCGFWPNVCLLCKNVYLVLLMFWLGCLVFWYWVVWALCIVCRLIPYSLEINPLSVALFANIFSHSVCCLFAFFMVFFAVQNDAGNSNMPVKLESAPIKWKGGSYHLIKERKKLYAEFAKIISKNKSSIHENLKEEKNTC